MPNLNVNVALEGELEQYIEIPFMPKSECPELPFPPTFTRVIIFLSLLLSINSRTYQLAPCLAPLGAIQCDDVQFSFYD